MEFFRTSLKKSDLFELSTGTGGTFYKALANLGGLLKSSHSSCGDLKSSNKNKNNLAGLCEGLPQPKLSFMVGDKKGNIVSIEIRTTLV